MLTSIFIVPIAALLWAVSPPAKAEGAGDPPKTLFPYPIQQTTMSNGLRVVTVPYDSPGLASFYVVVRAGSREEVEAGKTGFAHFFEHMMFRGTDKYSKEAYGKVIKTLGANANANTSQDRTLYHFTGNASMLETMFELEADRFQNLKYSVHDFKTEAGAVKGEYTKNNSNPTSQLYEKTLNAAFDKHTYKHTTMGFFEDVVNMPNQYEYSLQFFDRFYRPEYTTVMVVGDVKQAEVNRLAEKYLGNWKRGSYKPTIQPEEPQKETRLAHVQHPAYPATLWLNYKGPAFSDTDKDLPALELLSTMLFNETSPLYQKLVIKEQKVRSVFGGPDMSRDPNLMTYGATLVKAEDLQYVKDEITKALEEAKTKAQDPKKLADTKSRARYSLAMSLDSPDQIANTLSLFTWLTGDPASINKYYGLYDQVTTEDLMRVAKKYFSPNTLTISTISPATEGGVK
jgi:zinc protease